MSLQKHNGLWKTPVLRVGAGVIVHGVYCNDSYGSKPHGMGFLSSFCDGRQHSEESCLCVGCRGVSAALDDSRVMTPRFLLRAMHEERQMALEAHGLSTATCLGLRVARP